jgi:putative membrane protein
VYNGTWEFGIFFITNRDKMEQNNKRLSWKAAFWDTKGPETVSEMVLLFFKGVFMGVANIIPGVSGGTIALITGVYAELLQAIRSFNMDTIRYLKQFKLKEALNTLHIRFLLIIGLGVAISILSLAHIITYVFTNFQVQTWALFFGLVLASILVMGAKTRNWIGSGGFAFINGTVLSYYFVALIPVSTPDAWWFILIAGMVVICTMILPGLSGSFLLLILGKYEYIIGALKQPFLPENFVVLAIFGIGCVVGIVAFSRLISVMLDRFENVTMAVLTGIMCGSMRKIWPWKEVLETRIIQGKEKIISEANVLPTDLDSIFFTALVLMVVGFILVLILEKTATKKG